MNWYIEVWKKYAQFTGRARRSEYWFFALFNTLIGIGLWLLSSIPMLFGVRSGNAAYFLPGMGLLLIYSFATILPSLSVMVRRLHDTGKSGWWFLISFIPVVGTIILLVFLFTDSQPGPNQYGPNPKGFGLPGEFVQSAPRY